MGWLLVVLAVGALVYGGRFLRGPDLREFDRPTGEWHDTTDQDAEAMLALRSYVRDMMAPANATNGLRERLSVLREQMDNLSEGLEFDGRVESVVAGGVAAEWVVADGADTSRRVLLIHGGAFALGSARGHRKMSARMSAQSKAAVLAIDYRLWPEFGRKDALQDINAAYEYLLAHGPDGPSPARETILAGDSAGGNLVLVLAASLRDRAKSDAGLKQSSVKQATAVVAICPTVDSAVSGPSVIYNADRDLLLGDLGKLMRRIPHWLFVLATTLLYRMHLPKPEYSPVFGSLAGLPPTLIHASDSDSLFSDAIRYTNKAMRDGSPVRLQVWRGMQHDWHIFADDFVATEQAWQAIGSFIEEHCKASAS